MVPPVVAMSVSIEEHTAHASFGSVSCAEQGRLLWYQLGQVSGPSAEACNKADEGIKATADKGVDSNSVVATLVLRPLQCAKQASRTWDGH